MVDVATFSEWSKFCRDNPTAKDDDFAAALKDYAKSQDGDVDKQIDALEQVMGLAETARKKNVKNKEIAGYFQDVLKDARVVLSELQSDDQEPDGVLNDERDYKKYLRKAMNKLKKAPMTFAVGLGQKPEDHRIIFHKSKAGKALLAVLKDQTDLKKLTFGLAGGHEDEKTTLTLALEGKQLGGLKKKCELFLKYFKPLPFDTIMLMVEGEIAEDIPDPDDGEDQVEGEGEPTGTAPVTADAGKSVMARLAKLKAQYEALKASDPARAKSLAGLLMQAGSLAQLQDFAGASLRLDEAEKQFGAVQPAPAENGSLLAAVKERLAKLKAQYEALKTSDPARAKSLAGLLMQAGSLAQAQDYEGASLRLDEAEKQVGAARVAATETGATLATVKERLTKVKARYEALKATDPGRAKSLVGLMMLAGSLAQAQDFDGASLRLDDIEKQLDAMEGAARASASPPASDEVPVAPPLPSSEEIPPAPPLPSADAAPRPSAAATEAAQVAAAAKVGSLGTVALAKLRLKLRALKSSFDLAGGNLEAACRVLLETEAFRDDPQAQSSEVLAAVASVGTLVPPVAPVLLAVQDALDKLANARAPEDRAKHVDAALKALDGYRAKLDAVPLLRSMEDSAAGDFKIHSELAKAMDELAAGLRG